MKFFFSLPTLRMVIRPLTSAGLQLLPPPVFCIFLFIIIYWADFYSRVLCSHLLIYFLFQSAPAFCCSIGFWRLPALHVVFLPQRSAGLRLRSPVVLSGIYLFIDYIAYYLSFFFPHFARVDVLVGLATTPVRISSLTERLTSKVH
jgi:hypothetical protein